MKKLKFIIFFLFISFSNLFSQNLIIIKILDSTTGFPINGASILNNSIGGLSDNNGIFHIKKTAINKFTITHVAYLTKEVLIVSDTKTIFLSPKVNDLRDISIKSNVFNLILDAISKIKINYYYDNETVLDGWAKQTLIDKNKDSLNEVVHGIYDQEISQSMLYPAYKNITQYPLIRYKDVNQRIYRSIDSSKRSPESYFVNFIDDICDADFVLKRKNFIHNNSNKYYRYVSNGIKIIDDRKVIEIFFYSNKNKIGTLYIDVLTHAFVACNYYEYSSKFYEAPIVYRNTFIQYQIDTNNKWHIKNIYIETKYSHYNIIMKQYYKNKFVSLYQNNDTIKFIQPPFIDYLNKSNIIISTKINTDEFKIDNQDIDSIIKYNRLKLEKNSYTQKKIKKSTAFTNIFYNSNNFNLLFLLQNIENAQQISYNFYLKLRLYKNLYYYSGRSISNKILNIFSPQYIAQSNFQGLGYNIPLSTYFPKNNCFVYIGYFFEKTTMKNKILFSQDDIFLGFQFEQRINKYLGLVLDIGTPIKKLNNYNNTEIIKNRNIQLGLGITFRIN